MADPTPKQLTTAAADALSGVTHGSGADYPLRGQSNQSPSETFFQRLIRRWHLVYEWLHGQVLPLAVVHVDALKIGVYAGVYRKADGSDVSFAGAAEYTLGDNLTDWCVWLDHATNALDDGASWPVDDTTYTPLALVDTASGTVVAGSIRDRRQLVMLQTHASSTSPTGTTGTAFTLDSDNAGAGADQQVRCNRGSDDAEDAAVEWDESNDRFNMLSQHTTGTVAPINVDEVLIDGTTMVDGDGAAKVQSGVAGAGLVHTAGVLTPDVDDVTLEVDGVSDELQVKDGGISTAKLSDVLADKLAQVSIGDASGASPLDVTVQVLDMQGNNLAESVVLELGVYDDSDGEDQAANATISVQTGTDLSSAETKVKRVKTNASGTAVIRVTDGTAETVYALAGPTTRSKLLDCSDIGTVTFS